MKKVINHSDNIISEMVKGIAHAYPNDISVVGEHEGVIRKKGTPNKVAVVVGGGSGHEPMFFGYVGEGMADAAVIGNFFAAPNPMSICKTVRALEPTAGVLFIYGNYAGDVLNFEMASEMLELEGIETINIKVTDDLASAPKNKKENRRGIAGDLFVIKVAGAAAKQGLNLEECARIAEKANQSISSIGVGIAPFINPINQQENFHLGPEEIEFGLGIHGEPGIKKTNMQPANELVDELFNLLVVEQNLSDQTELIVMVNGMGSTTLMELYIVNNRLAERLNHTKVTVIQTLVGNYCTTQEMAGFSISLFAVDQELKELYLAPANSLFFKLEGIR